MSTRASFQSLASNLVNDTFSDFRDSVTIEKKEFDYETQTDTVLFSIQSKGIRLNFSKSQFNSDSVQQGDYKIVMVQNDIGQDITIGDVSMNFNGKDVQIINISEDAARAAYTFHVRDI